MVDFSFVRHACRDFYVAWGRDAWDPVLLCKMVFRQFLSDLSDREVEEQIIFNMAGKWFLGLSAEEFPPDHTTWCRCRQRLGAEGFRTLCNAVVEQARSQGFVSDRRHIPASTHIEVLRDRRFPEGGKPPVRLPTAGSAPHPIFTIVQVTCE